MLKVHGSLGTGFSYKESILVCIIEITPGKRKEM